MKIGIGLPAMIPGTEGSVILDWARRADSGPFSTLAVLDRLVFPNFEALVTLAAAAGTTRRIRLMTTVLLAPLRNPGILAKQAASLDALSGGRLTLGLGVGRREDDYLAAPMPFNTRGRRFAQQLATMKRIWSGQPLADGVGPVGPPPARPGGPELLIGGTSPQAFRRLGRWADGYMSGGDPAGARQFYDLAEAAWKAAARPGRPRLVAASYYALGPDPSDRAGAYIRQYYAGPAGENQARGILRVAEAIRSTIQTFGDLGVDELVFWPCIADLDQVDRLAELVG